MKANIHPQYFKDAKVTCVCGHSFTTGSTQDAIRVDICSKCHPLFTGSQKFVDTLGRVEKFQQRSEKSKEKMAVKQQVLQARALKHTEVKTDKPSLKDLLMQARKQAAS